jgi:hypothetical protein
MLAGSFLLPTKLITHTHTFKGQKETGSRLALARANIGYNLDIVTIIDNKKKMQSDELVCT